MKANINTTFGKREVAIEASYKYKGMDIFLTIEGSYTVASEWKTGCRITSVDVLGNRKAKISSIVEKTNAVLDIAEARGSIAHSIEKMVEKHGVANEGEMPLIGDVVIAEVSK